MPKGKGHPSSGSNSSGSSGHHHHSSNHSHSNHSSGNSSPRRRREQGILTEFDAFVTQTPAGAPLTIPVTPAAALTIATVTLHVDDFTDRVWLTGTVGWRATADLPTVTFRILRNGVPIFSTQVNAESGFDNLKTTSFTFVDKNPVVGNNVYTLSVQANTGTAQVIGPVVLTAAELERNRG